MIIRSTSISLAKVLVLVVLGGNMHVQKTCPVVSGNSASM